MSCIYKYKGKNYTKDEFYSLVRTTMVQPRTVQKYEKVLFPTGDTASKVEGHTTLEEFKKQKEDRIKFLQEDRKRLEKLPLESFEDISYDDIGRPEGFSTVNREDELKRNWNEINQLKQELERIEKEGFGALKPIYNFYENIVTNILKKNGYSPQLITDEYGNTWNEVQLTPEMKKQFLATKFDSTYPINDVGDNAKIIKEIFNSDTTNPHNSKDILSKILDEGYIKDPDLKKLAKNLQGINLQVEFRDFSLDENLNTGYMWYLSNGVILLDKNRIGYGGANTFAEGFIHEVIHGYSHDALNSPRTEAEKQFKADIEGLYIDVQRTFRKEFDSKAWDKDKTFYGLKDTHEFVSEIMSEPKFLELIKSKAGMYIRFKNYLKRLLNAIGFDFEIKKTLRSGLADETIEKILDFVSETNRAVNKSDFIPKNTYKDSNIHYLATKANKGFEVNKGFPMQLSNLDKMEIGDKRITIRTHNHETGIYKFGNNKYQITNLGLKNIKDIKNPELLRKNFIQKDEIKLEHVDSFFKGTEELYVYQITKLENNIVNQTIIEQIKDILDKEEAIYKKSGVSHPLIQDITNLKNLINKNESDLEVIVELIRQANHWTKQANIRIQDIKKKYNSADYNDLSDVEKTSMANQLVEIKNIVSAYTILDDIKSLIRADKLKIDPSIVKETISDRDDVIKDYVDLSLNILTDFLHSQAGEKLTKEQIKDQLLIGSADIGLGAYWLGATISSSDPIVALVAKNIKSALQDAHLKDILIKNQLTSSYSAKEGNKNNVSEFNAPFMKDVLHYEAVPIYDDKGELVKTNWEYVKKKALVTRYKEDEFDKNKREFFKRIGQKPESEKALKEWNKKVSKFFKEHTQVISDPEALMARKKEELSERDYILWLKDNTKELEDKEFYDQGVKKHYYELSDRVVNQAFVPESMKTQPGVRYFIYSGDFIEPKHDKYYNPKFDELMKDEYYRDLYNTYNTANKALPASKRLKYGVIPQVEISGYQKAQDTGIDPAAQAKNVWEWAKRVTNTRAIDSQYGITDLSGQEHKYIPLFFTGSLPESSVSHDLLSSVLLFSKMSNNYTALKSIEPQISMIRDFLVGNIKLGIDARKVAKTDLLGNPKKDPLNGNIILKEGRNLNNDQLLEFLDHIMYGQSEIKASTTLFGNEISLNKVADNWAAYNSILMLSGNLIAGMNNIMFGNYSNLNESIAGKHMDLKNWAKAELEYTKLLPKFMGDLGKIQGKSLVTQMAELFDAFQGEFSTQYGRNISGNALKRAMSGDALFMVTNGGEHQIQMTGFIGMLLHYKVKTKSGEEIPLYEAYELNDLGNLKLKDNVIFTEQQRKDFSNKVHALNKQLHGNYNTFDKSVIQRRWLGKLAIMFRKHIYTGWKRRYAKKQIDFELMDETEGYYRTFMNVLKKGLISFRGESIWNWNKLEPFEKQAVKRTLTDLVAMLGTFLLFAMLKAGSGDDNKDKWLTNHLALQARRLQGDINFYLPVGLNARKEGYLPTITKPDFLRLMKTPAVSMTTLERIIDIAAQISEDPFEEYQKNTNIHNKGDNKLKYELSKMIPLVTTLGNSSPLQHPDNQLSIWNK